MRGRIFAVAALAVLTGGCAEMSTIYHSRTIKAPQTITVDAYQRNIAFVPDGTGMRMCAEAAPDTFAAISASLGAEADVKSQSGKLAAALNQSGASIERTQTVNLLRESMYRTCERYLSGAISKETLIVQAARDQRAMVAVLAIEQLTRTARPPSTVLSAGTTSASVMNGDQVAKMIGQFSDERAAAKTALDKADGTYKASLAAGMCDTVTTAPAADATTKPSLADWTTCTQDKATLDQAQKTFDAADTRLTQVLQLATQVNPVSATANTGAGPNNSGAGGSSLSDPALAAVADAIVKIVNAPGIDESLMFCISYLSVDGSGRSGAEAPPPPGLSGGNSVADSCLKIIETRANNDEKNRADLFHATVGGVTISEFHPLNETSPAGRIVFDYISTPKGTDKASTTERMRRRGLVQTALKAHRLSATPRDVTNFSNALSPDVQAAVLATLRTLEDGSSPGGVMLKPAP